MSKLKTIFECQACGHNSTKWLGKCPDCGSWNSFVEEKATAVSQSLRAASGSAVMSLTEIAVNPEDRLSTGMAELDRVLGGGIVSGSVVLIGGDPGIGKSTIVLQMLNGLLKGSKGTVLYVSGEESLKQIRLRSMRLSIDNPGINVISETCIDIVLKHIRELKPSLVVVDSIQTVFLQDVSSAPGSVGQVRECAYQLMQTAKRTQTPIFLIGHVTKDGAIAGPRVLEHIVDTVLYFEGDRGHSYRIIRAVKNRFGSTNEIGVFEMQDIGLVEIDNPSEFFMDKRSQRLPGSVVIATVEGTRPLLIELQALVGRTSFGIPRRTGIGVDINRVGLLIAVLEKICGMQLGDCDVFINVVGGLKIIEPAFDLGIICAIVSSLRNYTARENIFMFGEVGLTGELRPVSMFEQRLREGEKIGFDAAIVPAANIDRIGYKSDIEIIGVKDIDEALSVVFNN